MFGLVLRPKIDIIMVDRKNPPWYTSIKFYVGIQRVKIEWLISTYMRRSRGMIFESLEAFPECEKQFPIAFSSDNTNFHKISKQYFVLAGTRILSIEG